LAPGQDAGWDIAQAITSRDTQQVLQPDWVVETDLAEAQGLDSGAVAGVALAEVVAHITLPLPHLSINREMNAIILSPGSRFSREKPPGSDPGSTQCKTLTKQAETNNEDCHQCPERIT